jgi:chromosome segregation ATPase
MNLTPAQLNAIRTWTEERDTLLRDIGTYSTELSALKESTREEASSLTDLENRIAEVRGRLAELDALEELRRTSVANDVAELEARKSRLEGECAMKESEIVALDARKAEKVSNIETLVLVHDKMSDQAKIVDEVVGQVIATSELAVSGMKTTMAEIEAVVLNVISKSNENIAQTNIVIEGLPKFIFNMQKPIPVRRTYPTDHPNAPKEEELTPE